MRLVVIDKKIAQMMGNLDPEFLYNKQGRPCLLVIRLNYRGRKTDFAIPLRSNIHPAENKAYYFNLPPRSNTKDKHRHGLHYAKMFPIHKRFTHPFHIEGNIEYIRLDTIIQRNAKIIIQQAQSYLDAYADNNKPTYAVNIDLLLEYINSIK